MALFSLFQSSPALFITTVLVLGLLVGSFLNVVIYRLPIMMEHEWQAQCDVMQGKTVADRPPLTLSRPPSRCPHCGHAIEVWENIPVLSYLLLAGKCAACRTHISIRYPLIEMLTGVLSAFVAWHFGFTWACLGALLLTWTLIALTFIDADHQLLPDSLTLPLLWLGMTFNLFGIYTDLHSSVVGAMAGYLSLWLVYHAFKLATGKEGMGYGDFKLLAALGAWMGWKALPGIILLSSFVGALFGILLIILRLHQRHNPIPFGPYLAVAGWLFLIWGEEINTRYLGLLN